MVSTSTVSLGRRYLLPLLFLAGASLLGAQDEKATVREVVDGLAARLSLTDQARVLCAQIEDSLERQTWKIQLRDPNYKSDRRLVELNDGRVVSDAARTLDAIRDTALVPLEAPELTESTASLRARAHAMAKAAGIEPKTYRFVLFHPKEKPSARWLLFAYDGQGHMLGRAALDATTSEVLASTWGTEALKAAQANTKGGRASGSDAGSEFERFGRDVERTFKGIGADLEEFFTGKRTIDK